MPLDTSSYSLALLRLDGRRWNELRRIRAQISTQPAADGSSCFEIGNTRVICHVTGPQELRRTGAAGGQSGSEARVEVEIRTAGFSGVERKKPVRTDKRTAEMQHLLASSFSSVIPIHQYPHSTVSISLHVLSLDGGLLAALVNATTLALIDAGVPMLDYLVACTAGSTLSQRNAGSTNPPSRLPGLSVPSVDVDDPLLDLNGLEEQDLPFLTVATLGGDASKVSALVLETRMSTVRLEEMLSAALDGCKSIKKILDKVVREHGKMTLSAD